ncbi:MAG: transposase, partial [Okeania sp. SIO2H7]|nr:transposase [Okeania sp. SIO2H7]
FPTIHQGIDWSRGFKILEQQLQEIVGEASSENIIADKLFQVWLLEGTEIWVLIHIEIQSQRQTEFGKRMYQYNYRAFDRYEKPVLSLALLGDDSPTWRPSSYSYGLDVCQMQLDFATAKILDYEPQWEMLEQSTSPIAIMLMAHLKTQATTSNLDERLQWKWTLARSLFEKGYTRDDIILLFRIVDKMMALSAELQQGFKQQVITYQEERKMPFLSTIEEDAMAVGIQQGMEQGIQQGMERGIQQSLRDNIKVVLETRFGEVPSEITEALGNISDISVLQPLLVQAVTINSLSDFKELFA